MSVWRAPAEQCRSERSEDPDTGAEALGYLGLFQVTRRRQARQGDRSKQQPNNGYVPKTTPQNVYKMHSQAKNLTGMRSSCRAFSGFFVGLHRFRKQSGCTFFFSRCHI
jgi:hypothetical protein